jgi:HAD superfamily hydrolase (TIGR01549 family)
MIKTILFDFDGVLIDSMSVRDEGFKIIAEKSTNDKTIIEDFLKYHRLNAGLSRFVKIKYLYENMLNKSISENEIQNFANEFSTLMKNKLIDNSILIGQTIEFIKSIHKDFNLHIVSGSEEKELNYLCRLHDLSKYFITIEGSPTHKNDLVKNIMIKYNYNKDETILIGDSITDYNAAKINKLKFFGFNNLNLVNYSDYYINNFKSIKI